MVSREQRLRSALAVLAMAMLCASDACANSARSRQQPATLATLLFDDQCAAGSRITVAAVGDLLFHDALQLQAYKPGATFRQFWAPLASVLAGADITYGNLESPMAAGVRAGGIMHKDPGRTLDRIVYGRKSDALIFNVHPSLALDLKASGFTLVSIANNHTADRGPLGIDRTLEALGAAGLAHTGARARKATQPWHVRTSANGVTLAWVACTYGLNGMPDPHNQVLQCHRDRDIVLDEIRALARDATIDAVIVTPHWGEENQHRPAAREKALARGMVDAGATAVLGAHPHVLQPWEKLVAADGREALVIYSLGNFISNQQSEAQRTGMIALLELTKPTGERARMSAAGYIPTFVEMSKGHRVTELQAGRSAYDAVTRIVPPGNRVAAAGAGSLPRVCKPAAPLAVASAQQVSATSETEALAQPVEPPPLALVSAEPPRPEVNESAHAAPLLDALPLGARLVLKALDLNTRAPLPGPRQPPHKAREAMRPVRPSARGHAAGA